MQDNQSIRTSENVTGLLFLLVLGKISYIIIKPEGSVSTFSAVIALFTFLKMNRTREIAGLNLEVDVFSENTPRKKLISWIFN